MNRGRGTGISANKSDAASSRAYSHLLQMGRQCTGSPRAYRGTARSRISSGILANSVEPSMISCAEQRAGAVQEGPRTRVACVRGRQHGGLAAQGSICLVSKHEKIGHLGEKNYVPELGFLEAVPAQGGAAQAGRNSGGMRPPPPVDRGVSAGGGTRDRPQQGSRNRRLGTPGPDVRRSECGGCERATPPPSRLPMERGAGRGG